MPFETIADFVANKRRGRVFNKWTENNGATLLALLRAYFDSYNASYDPVDHLNVDTILNVTEERNRPGKLSKLRQIEDIDSRLAYHLGELKSRKFDFRPLGDALGEWDASPERKAQLGVGTFIEGGTLLPAFDALLDDVFVPYYTATKAALESSGAPPPEAAASGATSSTTPVPEPAAVAAAPVEAAVATPAPVEP